MKVQPTAKENDYQQDYEFVDDLLNKAVDFIKYGDKEDKHLFLQTLSLAVEYYKLGRVDTAKKITDMLETFLIPF